MFGGERRQYNLLLHFFNSSTLLLRTLLLFNSVQLPIPEGKTTGEICNFCCYHTCLSGVAGELYGVKCSYRLRPTSLGFLMGKRPDVSATLP